MTGRIAATLAIVLVLATLTLWGLGIWFTDGRWGGLGVLTAVGAIISAVVMGVTWDEDEKCR